MMNTLAVPGKYIQGKDAINDMYKHIRFLGTRFLILTDNVVKGIIDKKIKHAFEDCSGCFEYMMFSGEATDSHAQEVADYAVENKYDVIIGAGGGKSIDCSKYAAQKANLSNVIIPTIAATDAPCSAISVVYDENGGFAATLKLKRHPDVVIVDTEVIMNAPARMLVAGIGDAFATYYEAKACKLSGVENYTDGVATNTAYYLAKLCNEMLFKYAVKAVEDIKEKTLSKELEAIIETNIYLSGVGFENNGCAIAHGIYNGMSFAEGHENALHGEMVAYGTLVQLAAEYIDRGKWDEKEWENVMNFYKAVGLPVNLNDLGMPNSDSYIRKIAELTCTKSEDAHRMPFHVDENVIVDAVKAVESNQL